MEQENQTLGKGNLKGCVAVSYIIVQPYYGKPNVTKQENIN